MLLLVGAAAGTAQAQDTMGVAPDTTVGDTIAVDTIAVDTIAVDTTALGGAVPDTVSPDTAEAERVQIVGADSLAGDLVEGKPVRRLIGHVRLRQGKTRLRARRAVQYEAQGKILFTGDVVIIDEGDTLTADRVRYDTEQKVGQATGHVRLTDGEAIVWAPSGRYFSREDRAAFHEGVTLVDSATTLKSRAGVYFTEKERAEFYGNVRLWDGNRTYLEADSVTYLREKDVSIAREHVFIRHFGDEEEAQTSVADTAAIDTTERTLLFGQWAYHNDQTQRSRVRGHALLVQLRADSSGAPKDTLLMRAVHLRVTRTDTLERLIATDSVRIWQKDLAAVADSAAYLRWPPPDSVEAPVREVTRLYRNPIAWHGNAQLSGDTLRITGRDRSVDTLFVRSHAFVAQRDTALDRIQQLKGQDLIAFFEEDSLRRIDVGPNAQAIRFVADEAGKLGSAVKVSGDSMRFWIRDEELERMVVYSGIQGEQYEAEIIPQPFHLDGFLWVPERRPTKAALLDSKRVRRHLQQPPPKHPPPRLPVAEREREGNIRRIEDRR